MKLLIPLFTILLSSFSHGQQFTSITQNLTNTFEFVKISESNNVALIGGSRIGKSIDNGFTWTELNLGSQGFPITLYVYDDAIIINSNTYCLVGRDNLNNRGKIIRTTDGGLTWANVLESPNNSNIYFNEIRFNGSTAITGSANGIYRSTNNGLNWTYIPVSGFPSSTNPVSVHYNSNTLNWMAVPTENSTSYLVSNDDGLTWSSTGTIFSSTELRSVTNQDGNHLFTRGSTSNTCHLFRTDQNHLSLDTISMIQSGLFLNFPIIESFSLSNGEFLSHNLGYFYNILSADSVYYYNHTMVNSASTNASQIKDLDIGQTYGLAVGTFGAVSRIDLNQPKSIWLPATMSMISPTCPGDTIVASADYICADSWNWYLDGNIVSNSPTLNIPAPSSFGQHYVVLENQLNGVSQYSDTVFFDFSPLDDAPIYSISVSDTTPCYGGDVTVTGNFVSGDYSSSSVEIWRNDSLKFGPATAGASSFGTTFSNVTDQDTIFLISSKTQTCGITYDTTFLVLQPENDLGPFTASILSGSSSVNCWNDSLLVQLTDTDSTQSFSISTYQVSGLPNGYFSTTGGADTIVVGNTPLTNTIPPGPDSTVYVYAGITVSGSGGCSIGPFYTDSIGFSSPLADFSIIPETIYIGDTLPITNNYILNNRIWSVSSSNLNLWNSTDTVPVIYGAISGDYSVQLLNAPFAGCADSVEIDFTLTDPIQSTGPDTCFSLESSRELKILKTHMDEDGNIYYMGAVSKSSYSIYMPSYYFAKHAPDGSLIWEKEGAALNFYQRKGVITDFDIANDTIYALITIQADIPYSFDLISYFSPSGPTQTGKFLAKFDPSNGAMLSYYDLNNISQFLNVTSANFNTSGILVKGNQIYFSIASQYGAAYYCTDLNLNLISIFSFNSGMPRVNFVSYNGSSNSSSYDCVVAPKLKKMSDGQVVVVGHYGYNASTNGNFSYGGNYLSNMALLDVYGGGILAANYDPIDGFTDFTKIATTPISYNHNYFDIDKSDNISVVTNWGSGYAIQNGIYLGDSIVYQGPEKGTAIFQVDKNFDLNWYTIGDYTIHNELDVVKESGDVLVSGTAHRNITFTIDTIDYMMGNYYFPGDSTTTPPNTPSDKFILALNCDGQIEYGKVFQVSTYNPAYVTNAYTIMLQFLQLTLTPTPCGDIYVNFDRLKTNNDTLFITENNNIVLELENSMLLQYSDNCGIGNCQFLCLSGDSMLCSPLYTNQIEVPYSFNIDSVSYIVIDGTTQLDSGTAAISQFPLTVNVPSNSTNPQFIITSPVIDTFSYFIAQSVPVSYSYDSIMCWAEIQSMVAMPPSSQYEWQGQPPYSDTFEIHPNWYQSGYNDVTVAVTDSAGCITYDTLSFVVGQLPQPTFPSYTWLPCGQELIFNFNESDYDSIEWVINGNQVSNQFDSTNLQTGLNQVFVTLYDTLGCSIPGYTVIEYCMSVGQDELNKNPIQVYPNPVTEILFVEIGKAHYFEYSLVNGLGQKILSGRALENTEIEMSILPAGIYFLKVESDSASEIVKVVKK